MLSYRFSIGVKGTVFGLKSTLYPTKMDAHKETTDSRRAKTLEEFDVPFAPVVTIELPEGISKDSQSQPTE